MNAEQLNPEPDFTPASYKLRVNGAIYEFTNPEPTARAILERIGQDPNFYSLIRIASNGERRILALDEETDLRRPEIEEFTFASSRRVFNIYVDETPVEFDKSDPTGLEILQKVGKHPSQYALTQIILGEPQDQFISAQEKADLLQKGIEKFTSVPWDEVKTELTIVVNGVSTEVKTEPHMLLSSVVEKALEQTKNVGRPVEDWQLAYLADKEGNTLDLAKPVREFGFAPCTVLILSLKAGING